LTDHIIADIRNWSRGAPPTDDVTLLTLALDA
jgi:hypothetical protein